MRGGKSIGFVLFSFGACRYKHGILVSDVPELMQEHPSNSSEKNLSSNVERTLGFR